MRFDLHVHTPGSDGVGKPVDYARAAKAAGLSGLAITDHHRTRTAAGDAVAAECRALGLVVIRGCEYSTADGHCLVFGVDIGTGPGELDLGMYPSMQEVVDRVGDAGGFCIPSHPYHSYTRTLGAGIKGLRGIVASEVLNGRLEGELPGRNDQAATDARELGLAGIAGSDAHSPWSVGNVWTEIEGDVQTCWDLVLALVAGRCRVGRSPYTERRRAEALRPKPRAQLLPVTDWWRDRFPDFIR